MLIFTSPNIFSIQYLIHSQHIATHLKYIGYPIVNDPLYGHILDNRKLLLESYAIDFYHPLENRFIHIQAPIDPRFKPFSHIDLTSTIKMPLHKTHQK